MAAATRFRAPAGPNGRFLTAVNLLRFAILAIIVIGTIYLLLVHGEWFEDPARVKLEITAWGIWGPIVFIVLYAIGPSFLVPGAVMTIAGGLAFGTLWGAIYSFIGADIGAVVAFGAGRFLGHGFVTRIVSGRFHHLMEKIARHGFQIIFYLRVVPLIPYNALNLLAGASPIRFHDYFWASVLGMIPGTIVFAFLGDSLWHPASGRFILALGLIVLSIVAGEGYRRWSLIGVE